MLLFAFLLTLCANSDRLLPENVTILSTTSFPIDVRLRPSVGNGYCAHVVSSDTIYSNTYCTSFFDPVNMNVLVY